jgi:hypothetical protein
VDEYLLDDALADLASEEAETYGLPCEQMTPGQLGLLAAAYVRPN